MNPAVVQYIGVDVAKDSLQIDWSGPTQIPNTPAGLKRLVAQIKGRALHFVCEATGGYESALLAALWQAGVAVSRVNPRHVRDFARAGGQLAKTDEIDARILSAYAQAFRPAATRLADAAQVRLASLCAHREHLINIRLSHANCVRLVQDKDLVKQSRVFLKQLDAHIKNIETLLQKTVAENPELATKVRTLCSVKCVGFITATSLLAHMPELGTLNRQSCAALAGVAPFNCDSGLFRGQRRTSAGRPRARRALYMAALVASRRNPVLKPFYQSLVLRSKPKKLALTAVMRKLLIHLNSLLKPLPLSPT